MKTEINHTHKNSTANYIFFGITLSIFTLSIYFSFVQKGTDLYTSASVTSILNRQATTSIPVTEVTPIDLKEYLTDAIEEPLAIDNWMTDASWTSTTTTLDYINADYIEEAIPVQEWMVSTESWNLATDMEFTETAIPIESWMLNTAEWNLVNNNYFSETAITEETIPLESWMLSAESWFSCYDENFTEADIPLENWMLSTSSWKEIEILNVQYEEADIAIESWMLNISDWENTLKI